MTEVQRLAKIKVLKDMLKEYELLAKYNGGTDYDRWNALDMAINALSAIEDIKADIEGEGKKAFSYPNWEFAKGLDKAVEIIDRKIADAKGDKA